MGKTSRSLAASGGPSTRGLVLIVAVCFTIGALLYFFYPFPTQPPIGMCRASFFCLLADLLANNLARFDPSLVADGIVRISTPYGIIRVRLRPDGAPNHVRTHTQSVQHIVPISIGLMRCCVQVAHWVKLIQMGHYDGGTFYRAEKGYLLQGGAQYVSLCEL